MEYQGVLFITKIYRTPAFLELEEVWQRKLKESGFDDIESPDRVYLREWHSAYFQVRNTPEAFESKQRYFVLASQFLHTHDFKKRSHRSVWDFHAQGYSLREIAELMRRRGKLMSKDTVHKIVRELKRLMLEQNDNE